MDFEKQEREKAVQTLGVQREEISQNLQEIKGAVAESTADLIQLQCAKVMQYADVSEDREADFNNN